MWKVTQGLDKAQDVCISILTWIYFQHKKFFNIPELSLLLDELFENQFILLKANVDEVKSFQNLINVPCHI